MAINVIEGALSAAKADMIKGSDEAMNKVPEAQELEAVSDSDEGKKAAVGESVIAFHGRKILDESYKKARKQKLIRESRQRRARSKRRTRR